MKTNTLQIIFIMLALLCCGKSQATPEPACKIVSIIKPSLFVLSVGATPPDIKYTEEDANDIADLFKKQNEHSKLYKEVIVEKLTGAEATAANVSKKIGEMVWAKEITTNDVFILFISSHGYRVDGDFRIQASDFKPLPLVANKTSVSLTELLGLLDNLKAKKIIFFDACQSGNKPDSDLDASGSKGPVSIEQHIRRIMKTKPGYTIITSSSGTSDSYWHKAWENGAFTEALIEGLSGKADKKRKGIGDDVITIHEIYTYLKKRVPALCKEQNTPFVQRPERIDYDLGGDFPLVSIKGKDKPANVSSNIPESSDPVSIYRIKTKVDKVTNKQQWEHLSEQLFSDGQNGKQYLTGEVNFMGVDGILALRVKITIEGDASYYFAFPTEEVSMMIYFENGKEIILYGYQYYTIYNETTRQTEYTVAFDINMEDERRLHKNKIKGVEIGWVQGKGQYLSGGQTDVLIKQLNDVKRATEKGIIKKQRRKNNNSSFTRY